MFNPEKLLSELIALPSVNPAFLPPHHAHAGERSMAEFLGAIAASSGLEVSFQPVLPGRSNILARLCPREAVRHRVWLVPHLDTVNGSEAQFIPRRSAGRLFGRGACDTKGSIAAMLAALCGLAASRSRPAQTEITFAGVIDEENGQAGSRALTGSSPKPDLAIVGEPTRLKVVTAHKGSIWLRFETRGKSAHGACPELGRNAVHMMARIVELLETRYAAQLRRKHHPLLGSPTISVGVIEGGTQPNIVPDRCTMQADRRTLPGETEPGVYREVRALLNTKDLPAILTSSKQAGCLPLETNPRLPLVRDFLRSAGQRKPAGVHYFCDASVLAHAGIPSVVFGPGDIAQAHTADEWLSLSSLRHGTQMLERFLRSLP
jgi:acetylornithine deacetylase/succinyl-diaminopimelate desuccinylase-like protein